MQTDRAAVLAGIACAAVLASGIPSSPRAAQWTPPPREAVLEILNERIARGDAVGLVAAMVDGADVSVVAAGRRGDGSGPVDGTTVFEIGSVSKVFTTTLLAEMVVRGEVALDDPVGKFLPESVRVPSRNGRKITLLDLATAFSGLPSMPDNFKPGNPANPYADYTIDDLYAFLSSYRPTRDPGASYEYSNLGMGLLGHALARQAATLYEELVTKRILEPLGMHDTRITLTPAMRERLATGHDADLEPTANWDVPALAGAGAWRSTAHDLAKFLSAAIARPAGPLGEAFAMAMTPRKPTGRPELQIGLGWHVLGRDSRQIVWHNGQTGGYHACLGVNPATGANAVLLANSATNIDDVAMHLIDSRLPLRHPGSARSTVDVPAEILEQYVGRYELAPTFAIDVTREGDKLFVQATAQPRFRVFAATPTRFFLKVVEAEIEFTKDGSGQVTGLVLRQNGRDMPGRRVPPKGR